MVSPAAAHRLPQVFANPDRYDPDRFGPPRQEDRRTKHGLIGFGGGHHRCIGATFAQQQIKVIWSVILRRFELSLARTGHRPDYATFVVGPRRPCLVRYRPRRARGPGAAPALAGGAPAPRGGTRGARRRPSPGPAPPGRRRPRAAPRPPPRTP